MERQVICLFEYSGLSADLWARNGWHVYCYDKAHIVERREACGQGFKISVPWEAGGVATYNWIIDRHRYKDGVRRPDFLMAGVPCDDLAVSGAKHFETKRQANARFQYEAMERAVLSADVADCLGIPYVIENPVSSLSTLWRKPNYIFHPWEYGGYLPENDVHPVWPEYIAPRDAYPKKTCFWTGLDFVMPSKKPVAVTRATQSNSRSWAASLKRQSKSAAHHHAACSMRFMNLTRRLDT